MTSRRPPKAPTGSPPPITLPKHQRSGVAPDQPVAPAGPSRKPVMTSSRSRRAPLALQASRSPSRNPGSGAEVHVGRHGLLDDHAGHPLVELRTTLWTTSVARPPLRRTRRPTGQPEHGHATPPAGQQTVGMAVIAAVELDQHGRAPSRHAGARRSSAASVPDETRRTCSQPGTAPADRLGQQDLAGGRRAECRAAGRRCLTAARDHRVRVPEQHGAVGLHHVEVAVPFGVDHEGAVTETTVYGVPPTEANERTGESTPPGMTFRATANHARVGRRCRLRHRAPRPPRRRSR